MSQEGFYSEALEYCVDVLANYRRWGPGLELIKQNKEEAPF